MSTPEAVLGRSLRLVDVDPGNEIGLDLAFDRSSGAGRGLSFLSGGDCLGQALKVALLTPLGTDLFQAAMGFDGLRALTQPLDRSTTERFLDLSVRKTLLSDPRVSSVESVEVTGGGASRAFDVRAVVATRLSESVAVQVGAVDVNV